MEQSSALRMTATRLLSDANRVSSSSLFEKLMIGNHPYCNRECAQSLILAIESDAIEIVSLVSDCYWNYVTEHWFVQENSMVQLS